MINKERVQMLVDRLRSGKEKQAKKMLRNYINNSKCCLGVACQVFMEETGEGEWDSKTFVLSTDASMVHLPDKVMNWYGFKDNNPMIYGNYTAIHLNDSRCMNFNQIADAFEETFLK